MNQSCSEHAEIYRRVAKSLGMPDKLRTPRQRKAPKVDEAVRLARLVCGRGGATRGDIAELLDLPIGSVGRLIAPAIEAGWVSTSIGSHAGYQPGPTVLPGVETKPPQETAQAEAA